MKKDMALTMAKWWGERVDGSAHHDNGDYGNLASAFAGIMADSLNQFADESQINRFVDILSDKIQKEIEKRTWGSLNLSSDYGPCRMLSEAAKEAGISTNNFPWKTSMNACFYEGEDPVVSVSAGYRAPWVQIWPKEVTSNV